MTTSPYRFREESFSLHSCTEIRIDSIGTFEKKKQFFLLEMLHERVRHIQVILFVLYIRISTWLIVDHVKFIPLQTKCLQTKQRE